MLWPLQQQVQDLMAQMRVMQERIHQLEGRLALNSKNSSKRRLVQASAEITAPVRQEPQRGPTRSQRQHPAPEYARG